MARALTPAALACALAVFSAAWLGCPGGNVDLEEMRRRQAEGQGASTIDPLRKLLLDDPDNREASLLLGSALAESARFGEALFHLRRASRDGEFAEEAGLLLGATALQIDNHETAIAAADSLLARNPDLALAWLLRGQAALASSQAEIALESARRARTLAPSDFSARIVEASALSLLDRNDEAGSALEGLLEAAPEVGPEAVATACTEYARFQLTLRKDPAATKQTLDACSDVLIGNALWVDAGSRLYAHAGDSEAAEALVRRAVDENPSDLPLRMLLAGELHRAGMSDEGEATLLAGMEFPDAAPLWVALAKLRQDQGDSAGALDAVTRALEAGDHDTEGLRFVRADLLVDLGRLPEARAEAEALVEPLYRDIIHGRLELEGGHPARALTLFAGVLQQWPDHAGVRILAARAAHELGDEERALTELIEATRAAPNDTDASLLLSRLYLLRGDPNAAYAYARRQLEYRGVGQPESLLAAAKAARAIDDMRGARAMLETLASQSGQEALGTSELAAFVADTEGIQAGLQVLEDAGLDLTAAENDVVLRRFVRLELDAGRPDAALRRLDAVLAAAPGSVSAHALRAHVQIEQGDAGGARATFEHALSLQPEHAESLAGLGQLELVAGDAGAARSHYRRAVALEPETPAYRYGLAQAELAAGSADAAERELRAILRTHPEHAAATNDLAWLLALRGESLDRALVLAERAVRTAPSPESRDTLGFVHLRAGRVAEARAAFEAALEERPGYATARYHLALAHVEQGDEASAREALRLALSSGPFGEADEARQLLARIGG